MSGSYQTPAEQFESEYVVKKSRFIARVLPVRSREEVLAAVEQSRKDYPDARHHCWAYLIGEPADASNAGMNDDGEPAGTAGKPILNVLQYGHLGDVLVIVIRYFGGIKLGAGGLVRAYSTATRQALDLAPAIVHQERESVLVSGDFSCEQMIRHLVKNLGGEVEAVEYAEQVELRLALSRESVPALTDYCAANRISVKTL